MLYLGTSGYSYDDWVGPFYPPGTPKKDFFAFYVDHFNTVEINFTHYALPAQSTIRSIANRAPEGFIFTVKSYKDMTIGSTQDPQTYAEYRYSLDPMVKQGKLGCVLLQFPNSFNLSKDNVNHLAFIRDQLSDLALCVEFRHRSWVDDERTFDFLRDHEMAYCCVDEPRIQNLVPPLVRVTAPFAYVRFHGRNAEDWYHGEHSWSRYNYLYNNDELREWVEPVQQLQEQVKDTFVYFNNHYGANAAKNAQDFIRLLEE